jgi:hypothetical protein
MPSSSELYSSACADPKGCQLIDDFGCDHPQRISKTRAAIARVVDSLTAKTPEPQADLVERARKVIESVDDGGGWHPTALANAIAAFAEQERAALEKMVAARDAQLTEEIAATQSMAGKLLAETEQRKAAEARAEAAEKALAPFSTYPEFVDAKQWDDDSDVQLKNGITILATVTVGDRHGVVAKVPGRTAVKASRRIASLVTG